MNTKIRLLSHLFILVLLLSSMGCSGLFLQNPSCGFSFDMWSDNQHAAVLDYRLDGENAWIMGSTRDQRADIGSRDYGTNIGLQYDRPRSLYVKWIDESSGQVYEDTVDLRSLLPRDLERSKLYFLIYGAQLYVYLARTNIPLEPGAPAIGARLYRGYLNIQLYPAASK